MPGDKKNVSILRRWLITRKIPEADLRIEGKVHFLGWMLSGLLMDMRNNIYRDYFFDSIDMMIDQDYAVSIYPRLSFGPGQRYASKVCYIVQLTEGPWPELLVKGGWVIQ